MSRPGLSAVAAREVAFIRRDIVALLLTLFMPVLAISLLAGTFSSSVIRGLHVDVVDGDRSATSSDFVQAISAAPGVDVAIRSSDLAAAMHAVRSGAAIAAVYIPEHFERDILAGKRPQVVSLYNKQFLTPGNVSSSAIQSAVTAAAAALPRPPGASHGYAPGALVLEQYVLNNPALNYAQFLLRAILPTVLHVMVAVAGAFAAGSEFGRRRGVDGWMAAAGGSPITAIVGKLLPYVGIFALMLTAGLGVIHGLFGIPFRGTSLIVGAGALLMVVGYLSLGAFFVLATRNLALGLSVTGIICSPAFGFAGVGFPMLAMGAFPRIWGALLPLRWYIQVLFDQAAREVPAAVSVEPLAVLAGLAAFYFLIAFLMTGSLFRRPPSPAAAPVAPPAATGGSIVRAFAAEYRRVLGDQGVFGLMVLAPLLYAALYPQPYAGQLIRDIPIAVVDQDHSEVSRQITQALDAHEATRVAAGYDSLGEAEAAIARREVFGVVGIPAGTEREVLKGAPARVASYVDSAYFLLYNRTTQGIAEAVGNVSADIAARTARPDGSLYLAALDRSSPVEFLSEPLFNPTGGYAAYVVPAAFLLILQQTLIMGAATLGGVSFGAGGHAARRGRGHPGAVAGQALAHLLLVLPAWALYLVVMPHVYGYAQNPRPLDLLAVAVPFILAASFLGQFAGSMTRRRETAVTLLISLGLPLFFLVGVAWPPEAIPDLLRTTAMAIPSTPGIDALVRVNQMDASLADVARGIRHLWILAAIYAALAALAAYRGAPATEETAP